MDRKKVKQRSPFREEGRAARWFLLPSLLGIGFLVLAPFVETIRRSLYNNPGTQFVGLKNYRSVLNNQAFQLAVSNTGRFLVVCVPLLLAASLGLGLMVQKVGKGGRRFKTTFLLPMAVPVASVTLLWQVMFAKNGLANAVLTALGAEPVHFMGTGAAFGVLIFTYLWKNCGYDMILWLAGMDGISKALYEAAEVDGANAFQQFRYITLPGLVPTMMMVSVLSLLNTFKVFREAYLVAGRYPHDSIYLLQHLFNNWFLDLDLGRLTAGAVLMAAVLLVLILLLQKLLERRDGT
ncbi:MAG: sugar ABC transporter permease [Candidatus Faecousia sp.]|nr:sugar ABC transporter permease [Clostridiales bacterium]MDD7651204.1 sugar ABC transporter permease [Bacillota bacterium]MDY4220758.1 sugar ABC transporter permease [Candidatus Faecousia sp.]